MTDENRPIVMTKDGVYARDEGLITRNRSEPGVIPPTNKSKRFKVETKNNNEEVIEKPISRSDCIHKPKDK